MTDRVEISKRMQVTFEPDISKTYLEVKTRNGWKKVWWKKAKTIRDGAIWLNTANKIGLGLLCIAIIWAVIVKINH